MSIFLSVSEGAGDICNSISTPNYCDEPYSDLVLSANKVLSSWTEVWAGSYRSSARARFWFPGGAIWADFVFFMLSKAGDIYNLGW